MPTCCAPPPANMKVTDGAPRSVTAPATRGDAPAPKTATASAAIGAHERAPMRESLPPDPQGMRDVAQRQVGVGSQERGEVPRGRVEGGLGLADHTSSVLASCGRARVGAAGASSSTTCALVPPMPNELTPARRGPGMAGQGRATPLTTNGLVGRWHAGLGVRKCRLAARCRG